MIENNVNVENILSLHSFYFISPANNSSKFAYYWNKSNRYELYVQSLGTNKPKQISKGHFPKTPRSKIIWSKDDTTLIAGIDESGKEEFDIYGFEIATGKFFPIFKSQGQCYPLILFSDGNKLLFQKTTDEGKELNIFNWKNEEILSKVKIDIPIIKPSLSNDEKWIFFSSNETSSDNNLDIYRISTNGNKLERVCRMTKGSRERFVGSIDEEKIIVESDAQNFNSPVIFDLTTKKSYWLGENNYEKIPKALSEDKKFLLTINAINMQWLPHLYNINSGEEIKLEVPGGHYRECDFLTSEEILLKNSTPKNPSRLLLYNIESKKYQILKTVRPPTSEVMNFYDANIVKYHTKDGQEIEGLFYEPEDIEGKIPGIVIVHGGPKAQETLSFDPLSQCLTMSGFAVFKPNYRGSFGYGKKFSEEIIQDWGGKDAEDIRGAASKLRQFDFIDDRKVVIMGESYGGYSAIWQMTKHPEVWDAGIAINGITSLLHLYKKTIPQIKQLLITYMGDPEKNKELWADRSPISHVKNFKGPILLLYGENDPRCPVTQGRIFKEKLLELGCTENVDFEYYELQNEGHGTADGEQLIRRFNIILNFLKGKIVKK